jgi:hypothetical protein
MNFEQTLFAHHAASHVRNQLQKLKWTYLIAFFNEFEVLCVVRHFLFFTSFCESSPLWKLLLHKKQLKHVLFFCPFFVTTYLCRKPLRSSHLNFGAKDHFYIWIERIYISLDFRYFQILFTFGGRKCAAFTVLLKSFLENKYLFFSEFLIFFVVQCLTKNRSRR